MGMDMMDRDSKPVSHKNIGMSLELSLWSKKDNVSLQKLVATSGRALPADSAPARGSWRFFAGTAPGTTFPVAWLNHPCWWYNNRNENDEDKITMLGTISTKIGTIVSKTHHHHHHHDHHHHHHHPKLPSTRFHPLAPAKLPGKIANAHLPDRVVGEVQRLKTDHGWNQPKRRK